MAKLCQVMTDRASGRERERQKARARANYAVNDTAPVGRLLAFASALYLQIEM